MLDSTPHHEPGNILSQSFFRSCSLSHPATITFSNRIPLPLPPQKHHTFSRQQYYQYYSNICNLVRANEPLPGTDDIEIVDGPYYCFYVDAVFNNRRVCGGVLTNVEDTVIEATKRPITSCVSSDCVIMGVFKLTESTTLSLKRGVFGWYVTHVQVIVDNLCLEGSDQHGIFRERVPRGTLLDAVYLSSMKVTVNYIYTKDPREKQGAAKTERISHVCQMANYLVHDVAAKLTGV